MNDFEPTMPDPAVNESLAISLGLDQSEYAKILTLIKRKPSYTELGIFSAMWNEHCSYKSTKKWLRLLPGAGPNVIHGPGENAGVIDIGNGLAVAFKMESHNHPSYIEPYQGAATGVGGILRDIFTMGAQPIAAMNLLRLGAVDHPKTRHLLSGIVAGIAGYANSFGVPTVGGEVEFDAGYNGNCLVNVFAAGLVESDKIFTSAARGVGSPIIYLGAKTGRDGVGGATMASNEFNEAVEEKRPTVQVGDPYLEKCLCQACLELMASGAVLAIQDMGAAGLTCSAVEMGAKGGLGVHLKLDKVPVRETQMSAFEMMLSESQERMLVILKPGAQEKAAKIFQKWSLAFEEIGQTTDDGCLRVDFRGDQVACLPIFALADNAPEYDRPYERVPGKSAEPKSAESKSTESKFTESGAETLPPDDCADMVLQLLSSPNHCSKAWVYEQYDCLVQGHTLAGPGGDAGIVQIRGDEHRALAFCVEACQRYGKADPREAGRLAVGEAYRNLCAVGARPLGITDNLNFGNPENPVIMGQIVGAIEGIAEAARALSLPVVSGNVSLYNEMSGQAIPPTASIGAVGIIDDIEQRAVSRFGRSGDTVILVGGEGDHLGQTALMEIMHGTASGAAPKSDLMQEEKNGCFIRNQIAQGHLRFVHDIGSGGLALALAEMAISGNMGCHIHIDTPAHRRLFGEDQARYVVTIPPHECALFVENAKAQGIDAKIIGSAGGNDYIIEGVFELPVESLKSAYYNYLPKLMRASISLGT